MLLGRSSGVDITETYIPYYMKLTNDTVQKNNAVFQKFQFFENKINVVFQKILILA